MAARKNITNVLRAVQKQVFLVASKCVKSCRDTVVNFAMLIRDLYLVESSVVSL